VIDKNDFVIDALKRGAQLRLQNRNILLFVVQRNDDGNRWRTRLRHRYLKPCWRRLSSVEVCLVSANGMRWGEGTLESRDENGRLIREVSDNFDIGTRARYV